MKKFLLFLAALLVATNGAVWYAVYTESGRHELTVAFLDIGQGDAIFIEAPNGNQVLVDAGPNSKVLSELSKVMPWYDKTIDMIVITNPDKDHIGGFIDVLKRYKVSRSLEPGTENKTLTNIELHSMIKDQSLATTTARRGQKVVLDERAGVVLEILFPDRDVSEETSNDGSIVMRLVYGESEVMLTGDSTIKVEKEILAYGAENLQSDILKVGHHGSKTSTSEEFVKALNPQYAVISLGKENKYGHPSEETLATLSEFPLQVLRTDEQGTIVMKSNGQKFELVP